MVAWADGDSLDYYAMRVVPGKERMTCEILANRNILAKTPMAKFKPKSRYVSDCIERERPTFAGLAFVAFPREMIERPWFAIKKLHTVHGVIGMDHRPTKIPGVELLRLFDDLIFTTLQVAAHKRVYHRDDKVKFTSGALAGFDCVVTAANDDELRLLCTIFGRQTPVTLKANQLDHIELTEAAAA